MSNAGFPDLASFSDSLVALIERAAQGVVAVKAAPYRTSSGVSIGDNLVAVADHALRRRDRLPVQLVDGAAGTADILGRDPSLDLAILKVDGLPLKTLPFADPNSVKAGSLAAIVGLTTDAGPSSSLGIIGAAGGSRRTWRGGTLDHFFRLDANIYPSQSGAAVVDAQGDLIGLATPGLLRHSAVAISTVTLKRIAQELLQEGRIRHGYLGVGLQPVAIPEQLREKTGAAAAASGLIVLSVEPDSPAHEAKLQLGDILVSLAGKVVAEIDELQSVLRGDIVGRIATAVLLRGGERVEVQISISERARKEN
jgi:S1-C subfamily serine protease